MALLGIIAGSGLYEMPGLGGLKEHGLKTPFGEPSAPYLVGEMMGTEVAFLPRHGTAHSIPPAAVNYRANLWGFKEMGAARVISINATGGISQGLAPGDILVPDQVIDMTQGARHGSFYVRDEVVHVDFTEPFCPELRGALLGAGRNQDAGLKPEGTYVCVNGPRLESRAEIKFFATAGADIVGMTAMPEAALARELELCFCLLSVVTNHAAGITGRKLTTREVVSTMAEATEKLKKLLAEAIALIPPERACQCKDALKDARF